MAVPFAEGQIANIVCRVPPKPQRKDFASLTVQVAWKLRTSWRVESLLQRVAIHVAAAEGFRSGELSIAVVGARRMATLHRQFAGVPGPTDVLTFDLGTNPRQRRLIGEVVVCADVARRAAARIATSPLRPAARAELALYVTHGILHLAGYDDHTPADFRRIHRREDFLLAQLGFGPVFGRAAMDPVGGGAIRRRRL